MRKITPLVPKRTSRAGRRQTTEQSKLRENMCKFFRCPIAQDVPPFFPHLVPLPLGEEAGPRAS